MGISSQNFTPLKKLSAFDTKQKLKLAVIILVLAGILMIGNKLYRPFINNGIFPDKLPQTSTSSILSDTPTPLPLEIIIYSKHPTWQAYENVKEKYTVQYPPEIKLQPGEQIGRSLTFLNCTGDLCISGMSISVHDYDDSPKKEWLQKLLDPYKLPSPVFHEVMIQNRKSLIAEENTSGSASSYVLIPKEKNMYMITFPKGYDAEGTNYEYMKGIITTFQFL